MALGKRLQRPSRCWTDRGLLTCLLGLSTLIIAV